MVQTYYRPLGLCYGPDAEQLIAQRRAGSLGGAAAISFSQVERIVRDGEKIQREIVDYEKVGSEGLAAIEAKRPLFCGLDLQRQRIMGILNMTPDSFSDGGELASWEEGVAHGERLAKEGADILDIGGESTRPGSETISDEEELNRILRPIKTLSQKGHVISADTRKARVMREAAEAGAKSINDVSALQHDPESLATAAELGLPVILMHAQGDPRTMQLNPTYQDVALDVYDHLALRVKACIGAGIAPANIAVDPGIGFGKTFQHNVDILNRLTLFHGLGVAVLVGLSRKGFIGGLTGEKLARNRVNGSVGGAVHAALQGVHMLRVHDVKATVEALAVARAALDPRAGDF